jgi:hypothetical protein
MEDKTHTKILMAARLFGFLIGTGLLILLAALITWVAGMFVNFPFTWLNVGNVFIGSVVFNLIMFLVRK